MLLKDKSNYAVLISEGTSISDAKNGKVKSSWSILSSWNTSTILMLQKQCFLVSESIRWVQMSNIL